MPDPTTPLPDGVYLDWPGRTYPSGVRSRTTALGLTQVERGVFTTTVPTTEVLDVRQERTPT